MDNSALNYRITASASIIVTDNAILHSILMQNSRKLFAISAFIYIIRHFNYYSISLSTKIQKHTHTLRMPVHGPNYSPSPSQHFHPEAMVQMRGAQGTRQVCAQSKESKAVLGATFSYLQYIVIMCHHTKNLAMPRGISPMLSTFFSPKEMLPYSV